MGKYQCKSCSGSHRSAGTGGRRMQMRTGAPELGHDGYWAVKDPKTGEVHRVYDRGQALDMATRLGGGAQWVAENAEPKVIST